MSRDQDLHPPEVHRDVTLARFRAFVGSAQQQVAGPSPVSSFAAFTESAATVLAAEASDLLDELRQSLEIVAPWLLPHDALAIAGVTHSEDPYTELLAWLLGEAAHPASVAARQRHFLMIAAPELLAQVTLPGEVRTQVTTDDGIPDLVIQFDQGLLIVEAKTGTGEHPTPSGTPQTLAYPEAVRRAFGLGANTPVSVAFLTLDGALPANPRAVSVTWAGSALAVCRSLHDTDLPGRARTTFAVVLNHLLTASSDGDGLAFRRAVALATVKVPAVRQLALHVHDLRVAHGVLRPERPPEGER